MFLFCLRMGTHGFPSHHHRNDASLWLLLLLLLLPQFDHRQHTIVFRIHASNIMRSFLPRLCASSSPPLPSSLCLLLQLLSLSLSCRHYCFFFLLLAVFVFFIVVCVRSALITHSSSLGRSCCCCRCCCCCTIVSSSKWCASFFLSDLYFYVILSWGVCQRSFLFIRDQKKYVFGAFDWTVLFYKLVYKTKRSAVIGLLSSESTPYYAQ